MHSELKAQSGKVMKLIEIVGYKRSKSLGVQRA